MLPEDDEFIAAADAALLSVEVSGADVQSVDVSDSAINCTAAPIQPVLCPKEPAPAQPTTSSKLEEDDLVCSICTELFIDAVTLACSHSFCKFCIELWRKNNDICPICRTKIKGQFPTLIVNNLVEKVSILLFQLLETNNCMF